MQRHTMTALIALLGLMAGNAHATYCKVAAYDASDMGLANFEFPSMVMKVGMSIGPLHDVHIGCTMTIPVRPGASDAEIVSEFTPRPVLSAYSHLTIPPMQQVGDESITFRRIHFTGSRNRMRTLKFDLVMHRDSELSLPTSMIVVTYAETTATGNPIVVQTLRFEEPGSVDAWMRVDWSTNSGTLDTQLGSTLQVRFVDSPTQKVLNNMVVNLPPGVIPTTIHQGRLANNDVFDGRIDICTSFPGQGGVSYGYLVPPPSYTPALCRQN